MTEADVAAFVGLAGDYNPLYTDLEHARSGPYGGPVAPGALVAALTTGLGSMDVPIPATIGLVGMSWKFLLPVQPGDTVGSRWRLSRKRNVENPRWGLAVWQVEVENQRGEVVATGEVARLIAKRELPAERTGRSRRRRSKGAPAGQGAADVVMAEPVPEPAPADVPPAAARRRRRRGGAEQGEHGEGTPPVPSEQPAVTAPVDAPAPDQAAGAPAESTPSRRRRRRRSSNGQGGAGGEGQGGERQEFGGEAQGGQPEREGGRPPDVPVESGTPAAPQPGWSSEVRPSPFTGGGEPEAPRVPEPRPWTPAEEGTPEGAGESSPDSGGLGRVFRRLRRP